MIYTVVLGVSSDCPNVIQLAKGMNVSAIRPSLMNLLQMDCCSAGLNPSATVTNLNYVDCDFAQRVVSINWSYIGLNGVINSSAIPPLLTFLNLGFNSLTGSFPILPSGLTYLSLSSNRIIGNIAGNLPVGLTDFRVRGNLMTGDLSIFPPNIQYLYLNSPSVSGNFFSGTLRLNRPIWLYMNDNWITDIIIQDTSQIDPANCDISNNPLLGNPNINLLTMCTRNGLYSASLLPKTISSTKVSSVVTTSKTVKSSTSSPTSSIAKTTISTSAISTSSIAKTTISKSAGTSTQPTTSTQPATSNSIFTLKTTFPIRTTSTSVAIINSALSYLQEDSISVAILHSTLSDLPQDSIIPTFNFSSLSQLQSLYYPTYFTNQSEAISIPTDTDFPISDIQANLTDSLLIYAAMAGLVLLCIIIIAGSVILKNPTMKSKFARKNSYGTLFTVNTKQAKD